jgi:hypothetical protein
MARRVKEYNNIDEIFRFPKRIRCLSRRIQK